MVPKQQQQKKQRPPRLWYRQPTTTGARTAPERADGDWQNHCLPIGNGYMGAMLAGELRQENIQFNEKTLWTGGPAETRPDYNGGNHEDRAPRLREVQRLLLEGETQRAARLAGEFLVGKPAGAGYGAYQNFGWVTVRHHCGETAWEAQEVRGYERELDLAAGTAGVRYTYGGAVYTRRYFMSYPDHVMAVCYTAGPGGRLDLEISLAAAQPGAVRVAEDGAVALHGELADNRLRYAARLAVVLKGGAVQACGEGLRISGARQAVLVLAAATDYKNEYPAYRSGRDPALLAEQYVRAAVQKGYAALLRRHRADYGALFGRVELDLGGGAESAQPTDELLRDYKAGRHTRLLEELLFQYGRYLAIASSRAGSLPANLQGVWNETNAPVWASDYHLNVNLQMNYWPAYVTNLAETALPLVDYVESLRAPGRVTAAAYHGIQSTPQQPENGFTAHTQNTPFGWTCPGWDFYWGWSPAAVPWILQNVWEYFEYTQDTAFLRARIYPLLREQCRFWQQALVQNPRDGLYYSAPAYSPEHGPITLGNTYEHVLVRQLLRDTARAAGILGVDEDAAGAWERLADSLRGEEIGSEGQLKEWFEETGIGSVPLYQPKHRHLSHLLGLYPGDSVHVQAPELLRAAVVSLRSRGDRNTGWGMGQRINAWARAQDGEQAHALIRHLLAEGVHANLLDSHPPFQIDGNFGYTAGVAEMLLQSNLGYIQPLPALPAAWPAGRVRGLVARGNFTLSLEWEHGALRGLELVSGRGGACRIRYEGFARTPPKLERSGEPQPFEREGPEEIQFATAPGEEFRLSVSP